MCVEVNLIPRPSSGRGWTENETCYIVYWIYILQECATPNMGLYGSMLHTCCSLIGQDEVGRRVAYLAFHSGIVYNSIKDTHINTDKSVMQAFLVKLHSRDHGQASGSVQ